LLPTFLGRIGPTAVTRGMAGEVDKAQPERSIGSAQGSSRQEGRRDMTETLETDVTIVGGGPVGLTLAMDLAGRGVRVTVIEQRERGEPPSVKCNHVAARSMELFRRLGVGQKLRDAGLPADYPNDIAYRTTMIGREITRIPIPCRRDRYTATGGPDTWWPTPEPPHRINQIFLEPILFEHAWAVPGVTILNRVRFEDLVQEDGGVTARARHPDSGEALSISARYLVGCDGGRSEVRRTIGVRLSGDPVVQRVQSSYIRAPQLLSLQGGVPAWGNISLNPRRSGTVYAIDGRETWLVHNYLRDDEADFDAIDRDWAIRAILGVGSDFRYEIISREDWFGRRLVADRLRDRRAFLCGDAAHIWVPYAGYGMNAGLADAANLGWLLAARLNGWRYITHNSALAPHDAAPTEGARTFIFKPDPSGRFDQWMLLNLGQAGSYILSPAHAVEGDVPLENILAFIDLAQQQTR